MTAKTIARSLAHQKAQLGARSIAVPLRIRPHCQRNFVEDVAVDHRNRSGVLNALHRVYEEWRRDAFEGEVHVRDAEAARAELAAQIVAARHSRQNLNG